MEFKNKKTTYLWLNGMFSDIGNNVVDAGDVESGVGFQAGRESIIRG